MSRTPRMSLRPAEIATGSVMAALAVAFTVVGAVIPAAAALQIVAIVPLAVVAQRHRVRALVVTATAATIVAFVAAGFGAALTMAISAVVGAIVGRTKRIGRGLPAVLSQSTVAGMALGLFTTTMLLILEPLRVLFLTAIENTVRALARLIGRVGALTDASTAVADAVSVLVRWWWVVVFVSGTVSTVVSAVVAWWILARLLDRLQGLESVDSLAAVLAVNGEPAPLPVRLSEVGYRYPKATTDALSDISLDIEVGQFVAVVGANGSGKSTLARVLVGLEPTAGSLTRPGSPGLGRIGGTALILQHPETQVLGSRVADDVVWGIPVAHRPDAAGVDALLREVGLSGLAERETSSLSGGELQRLAVAAALARAPRLLVADEATAMIDPDGQRELVELLASLPRRHAMAVVLVTHRIDEAQRADRIVHLHRGRRVEHVREWMTPLPSRPPARPPVAGPPILELRGVGHVYASKTPWATRALQNVDLTVQRGEGLLVVGDNGSGKSTLAWVLAGLITPTDGTCTVDGKAVSASVGTVALAFQHARLQLLRRTVAEDIASAAGPRGGSREVSEALDTVGLDRLIAGRGVDELSGGQMRRVALAGLLARRPTVLVLDEPLAGLDPPGRQEITGVLADLRAQGVTIVVISHDFDGMESVCTRAVTLRAGTVHPVPPRDGHMDMTGAMR